jgi:hypothetical protein
MINFIGMVHNFVKFCILLQSPRSLDIICCSVGLGSKPQGVEGTNQRRKTFGHPQSQIKGSIMFDYLSSRLTLPKIFGTTITQADVCARSINHRTSSVY